MFKLLNKSDLVAVPVKVRQRRAVTIVGEELTLSRIVSEFKNRIDK